MNAMEQLREMINNSNNIVFFGGEWNPGLPECGWIVSSEV